MSADFYAAVLLGALVGWLGRSLTAGVVISASNLITPIVALFVGLVINQSIRRRGELDKIPIESVSRLSTRIETLIVKCLEYPRTTVSNDPDLNATLSALSNEVNWLGQVVSGLDVDMDQYELLQERLFGFKAALSGEKTVNPVLASDCARAMRVKCLVVQWQICRRVLEQPVDLERLG